MEKTVKEQLKNIDKILKRQISSVKLSKELEKAVNYVIFPGGKRIRPLFSAMLAHDLGLSVEDVLEVAVSIEYIHAASLVHDDLPAMDNDDMRRGLPSCHKAFREAIAILCGDELMVLPYEIISGLDIPSQQKLKIIGVLAKAFRNLCIGQEMDIIGGYNTLDIYSGKTGALFEAAAKIAVIRGAGSDEVVELAGKLGAVLGVYFQVVDDLIDAKGIKGRGNASSDSKNKKQTFVAERTQSDTEQKIIEFKTKIEEILQLLREKTTVKEFFGVRYIISMVDNSLKGE